MPELSKYIKSEPMQVMRSSLKMASYNPREITEEAKKTLKRGIKKYGLVGGIVVNKRTGMTIVSGHQRVAVMDDLNKYPESDYALRVDLIDVDVKQEKELNVLMNNPNAQGQWNYDALRELIPDIDYKDAGLTDSDLSMIGVDYLLKTEEENDIAGDLDDLMKPVEELTEREKEEKAARRAAEAALELEAKKDHMKDVKAQVKEAAMEKAGQMDAYVVLSFSTYDAKAEFCSRFGFSPEDKFIKGEDFDSRCEAVIE